MKLKLDEQGHAVVADGKPVYVHDDGKEIPFDAPAAMQKIGALNVEAKTHRERFETTEKALKEFEGLDPKDVRKALETVKNLDHKKLVDAGEVDRVKEEVAKALQPKIDEANTRAEKLELQLREEKIGGSFARSKFITDKLAIPSDMVQARFGSAFKIEDGKVVAYTGDNKIFSRTKPGDIADFDEALEILIEAYPQRDHILKGSGASGGGASGGGNGGGAGSKTMSRARFDAMSVKDRMEFSKGGGTITD